MARTTKGTPKHKFEPSSTRAIRQETETYPYAEGFPCAVCGCFEDQCRDQQK